MLCKSALVALLSTVCVQSQNLRQSSEAAAAAQAAKEKLYAEAEKRKEFRKEYVTDTELDLVLPMTVQEQATHVSGQDAETTLSKLLSGRSEARLAEFKTALAPMYRALPKDREGLIEQRAARYTLHRLFVKRHNWFIKGLEPNGDVWHQNATNHSITNWVPAFLLNHMKKELSLDDLAAIAAAIEELIRQESDSTLEDVYKAYNLSHSTNHWEAHQAISASMVLFLGGGAWTLERPEKLIENFALKQSYWRDTENWFLQLENTHLPEEVHTPVDFAATAETVSDIGMRYGSSYLDADCQKLKSHLKGTWSKAETTGRVRLVDFYRLGIETEWGLIEKVEYLRSMGALDESNASAPMVIIPNYLGAMPNCLQATSMYAVCCRNECEDYLTKLEAEIQAASAPPRRIADLVRSMSPRELSPQLLGRLDSMAASHDGQVQLHGRLFAQWMHHVFPNECPYPHAAGASDPVTPDEWMTEGQEGAASEEERMRLVDADACGPEQAGAEWGGELSWSDEEELLSFETRAELEGLSDVARPALLLLALGAVLAAARTPRELRQKYVAMARINQRLILIGSVTSLAFATNLVNRALVVFIVLSGLVLKLITSRGSSCSVPALDKEKMCV